jgi:hypothetical protein
VSSLAPADFNNDGHEDLAIAFGEAGILLGDGLGRFRPLRRSFTSVGDVANSAVTADFNGDGHQDVAVSTLYYGIVSVLLGDGAGGLSSAPGTTLRAGPYGYAGALQSGDLNADGRPDLVLVNNPTSNSSRITVLLNTGARIDGAHRGGPRPPIAASRPWVRFGSRVRISADISCTDIRLPGRNVHLYRRLVTPSRVGRWYEVGATLPDRLGVATFVDRPPVTVQYRVRFPGDPPLTRQSSRAVRVGVAPRVSASLSAAAVAPGSAVHLRGRVWPGHPYYGIRLQRHKSGVWNTVATTHLSAHSRFVFTIIRHTPGVYRYRVYRPADAYHRHGASESLTVRVKRR